MPNVMTYTIIFICIPFTGGKAARLQCCLSYEFSCLRTLARGFPAGILARGFALPTLQAVSISNSMHELKRPEIREPARPPLFPKNAYQVRNVFIYTFVYSFFPPVSPARSSGIPLQASSKHPFPGIGD
jgi:hypothetical protein